MLSTIPYGMLPSIITNSHVCVTAYTVVVGTTLRTIEISVMECSKLLPALGILHGSLGQEMKDYLIS